MQVNFTEKELAYLYDVLLKSLENLKNLNAAGIKSPSEIKAHKKIIAKLETANPRIKDFNHLRQSQGQNPQA